MASRLNLPRAGCVQVHDSDYVSVYVRVQVQVQVQAQVHVLRTRFVNPGLLVGFISPESEAGQSA